MKTLLMLSGGPDSAVALWLAAKHGPVHCVHVRLGPGVERIEAEEQAARRVVDYVRLHTGRNVRLDVVDYGVPAEVAAAVHDVYHLAAFRAVYLIAYRNISRVVRCGTAEDVATGWMARCATYSSAIENMVELSIPRSEPFEWFDPFGRPPMSKEKAHRLAPRELIELAISCRSPRRSESGWRDCGECFKCRGVPARRSGPRRAGFENLLMLSGGPDSAAALWLAAQEGTVLAVHVRLGASRERIEAEEQATRRAVDFVRRRTGRNIRLDVVDYSVPADTLGAAQNDMHHLAGIRAAYLLAYSDIRAIWRAAPAHDAGYAARRDQTRRAWVAFHDALCVGREDWQWRDPFGWPDPMRKEEALRLAPRELIDLSLSCNRPVPDGAGGWRGCGDCYKCDGDWAYRNTPPLSAEGHNAPN